jgi:hypothetical protein
MKKKQIFLLLGLGLCLVISKVNVVEASSITCTGDKTQICAKIQEGDRTTTMYGDKGVYQPT